MAEKADLWMPLYIGDYLRDTRFLTLEEHGAYLLLLMEYWVSGPLPDDDRRLARLVGCSEHPWSMLRASLEQFFEVGDGIWRHKRADIEREKAGNLKEARKSKAKAAADARWSRRDHAKGNAPSIAESNTPSIASRNPPSPSPSHMEDDDGDAHARTRETPDLVLLANRLAEVTGITIDPSRTKFADQAALMTAWLHAGGDPDEIVEVVKLELARAPDTVSSLRYFDRPVRQAIAKRKHPPNGTSRTDRMAGDHGQRGAPSGKGKTVDALTRWVAGAE